MEGAPEFKNGVAGMALRKAGSKKVILMFFRVVPSSPEVAGGQRGGFQARVWGLKVTKLAQCLASAQKTPAAVLSCSQCKAGIRRGWEGPKGEGD